MTSAQLGDATLSGPAGPDDELNEVNEQIQIASGAELSLKPSTPFPSRNHTHFPNRTHSKKVTYLHILHQRGGGGLAVEVQVHCSLT